MLNQENLRAVKILPFDLEGPGFALPIFQHPYEPESLAVQEIGEDGTVMGFMQLDNSADHALRLENGPVCRVGGPQFYAFVDWDGIAHAGTLDELCPLLREFWSQSDSHEGVLLQIAELIGNKDEKKVARRVMRDVIAERSGNAAANAFYHGSVLGGQVWERLLDKAPTLDAAARILRVRNRLEYSLGPNEEISLDLSALASDQFDYGLVRGLEKELEAEFGGRLPLELRHDPHNEEPSGDQQADRSEKGASRGESSQENAAEIEDDGAEDALEAPSRSRRWAPFYESTLERILLESRRHAVQLINSRSGRVLEVGVGRGLELSDYGRHLQVVGIDESSERLDRARERVVAERLEHVTGLHEMDASDIKFPDNCFDIVAAMFVMTVPEPERVMRELARVTKPGGEVFLVNYFSQKEGVRGWVARRLAPLGSLLGWISDFDESRVLKCKDLHLVEKHALRPWGAFTMLRFKKHFPQ